MLPDKEGHRCRQSRGEAQAPQEIPGGPCPQLGVAVETVPLGVDRERLAGVVEEEGQGEEEVRLLTVTESLKCVIPGSTLGMEFLGVLNIEKLGDLRPLALDEACIPQEAQALPGISPGED